MAVRQGRTLLEVIRLAGTIVAAMAPMSTEGLNVSPLEAPLSQLERALIAEFVQGRGYDPLTLADLPEHERKALLRNVSIYASGKLTEVESREHFLDEIHPGGHR